MKRISLFLSCLFAAMSVFAGSLSGTLIGTATEYQFDYDFTVDIASKQVTMEGVLNHEAFVVDGMAIDVMLAGKIVGQAAMSNDTVSYTFADKYNRGDKLQLALKFNYTAGMTMSKPFAYEVAPVTHLYAKVPASSPNCYIRNSSPFNSDYYPMTLVEEGEDSTVYEYYFEDNYYHQTVILAWNFDYDDKYCSCVSNGNIFNFYIDSQDKVCDLKEAAGGWRKTFMLQVEGKEVAAELYKPMYWEPIFIANAPVQLYAGDIFSITSTYDGTPLTITAPAGAPYTVLEDNLIVQNADGLYTLAMDTTGGKNVLTMERAKNKNYYVLPGASYVGVGLDGKAFAGWNTAADISDHVLTINAGTESTDGNANGGIKFAAGNYLKLIAAAKYYVLAFDYKSNIDGVAEVQIVRAKGNPAEGDVVYAQTLPTADDWKQFVVELDKMEPIEAEDDDFLYIMVNMSGCQWKGGDAVDMREIRFVPYTKYEVTVPAETEVCRVKGTNAEFDADMTRVSDNVFSVAFIGNDYHATTYNYYSGPSAENIEVAADEKDAEPRWWAAADEVVAWKEAYCIPKYGYLMNDQLTQFAEVEYGSYLLENVKIAEEDSAYYIINICTEDTMKAAEVPAVAGEYKIELALADTSVVFTKTDTIAPDEKEYLCNMIWSGDVAISWDPSVAMNALAWGGYDWTTAKSGDKLTVYFAKTEGAAYTNLRFGNGFWAALPTTLADPTSAEDGTYGGLDEKTSMSIILSQADINVLVNEGGLVICGNGLNIKGVELCREADIECNVIWSGETALGNWEASVGDLSWGGYDWTTVKQGVKLTVRYEVDAAIGYTNLRFGNGSWNALPSTLADPATDKDGNYSGLEGTTKSIILTKEDLTELVSNGGLVLCGAGLIIKEVELCEVVELVCNDIWSGETALGSWEASVGDLSWGGYDWTTAKSGDKLTVYFTVDESIGYTDLRFGNGSWTALPSTLADPATDKDGNYSGFAADATSKSIRLSQADVDVLVSEGGLVLCGAGLVIKAVELCHATVLDCNDIWSGETALGSWEASVGDLSWGGYDWTTASAGSRLTVNFTVDESIGYTDLRFGNGSWNALPSTLADPATDKDGNYSGFAADATSKAVILSDADLNELVNNGGLVICGAGLVIKGIELCNPRQDGPAEVCFDIIDEAFNALDENASITDSVMTFAAANSAMNMWVEDYDLSLTNTLTIEYEATTDFQVLLQDEQGEEQLVADADTNIIVYHYLAAVDMANLLQLIFVAQEAGTVKINSICFSQVEYPTYYLGNKWDGAEEVSFREMSTDNYGVWTLTGVLGSDEVLLAFEAEPKESVAYKISEITEISGKELLVGDEVKFYCYEYIVNAIEAEVLVRPTYVKHPWESGEWTWAMMTRNEDLHQWEYVGIWGGQGFNINAAGPYDNGALWFAANSADVTYISPEGEEMPEPAVGTEVTICYQDNDTKAGVRYEIPTGLNSIKANVKAIKVMENGQMFIIRDNKVYNIVGACVRNK